MCVCVRKTGEKSLR